MLIQQLNWSLVSYYATNITRLSTLVVRGLTHSRTLETRRSRVSKTLDPFPHHSRLALVIYLFPGQKRIACLAEFFGNVAGR